MTPILFPSNETAFTSNGIGRLVDCLSCIVTEERNGIYECTFTYPINGKWYSELVKGGIIGVIHDDNHDIQPFDIYKYSAPIDGVVTFNAHHISYRLNDIVVTSFVATGPSAALSAVKTNSANTNPFTFTTDYTGTKSYALGFMRSARGALLGEEGSILQSWRGEYKFDKFNVSLLKNRGSDTGVTVRYGKNITDITREADWSGTYNAVAPFWTDGSQTVTLPEVYVQPSTPITPVKVAVVDMSTDFDSIPTVAQLRSAAVAALDSNKPWVGFDSIEIDFVALWQTPEYESVAEIQRVGLCDTVSVYWTDAGIVSEKIKVVRTEFNVLTERYDKIHLGETSGQYVAIEGGTPSAPDEAFARTTDYVIYDSVADLGLSAGSATISGAINALYNAAPALLICDAGDFANTEVPSQYGVVEIGRVTPAGTIREWIMYYGRLESVGDYRMFLDSGGSPTGTWVEWKRDPYTSNPAPLGTASPGSSDDYARGDHVHAMPTLRDIGTQYSIPSGGSQVVNVANSTRWVIFANSVASAGRFAILVNVSTTGTVGYTVIGGSAPSIITGTNWINIENPSSSYYCYLVVIPL